MKRATEGVNFYCILSQNVVTLVADLRKEAFIMVLVVLHSHGRETSRFNIKFKYNKNQVCLGWCNSGN